MNGAAIPTVKLEKDIGFWISEDLSSTTHVQNAKGKVMGEIIRIRRNFLKILNGMTRINPDTFWEVRPARNGAWLVKELATNGRKQRKGFFSYRVVQKWNLLPANLKTAPSLNCFKDRLDERILKK